MIDLTRVLIVEDHLVTRQGIRALVGALEGVEIVGEAASGEAALRAVAALRPSAVFMDLSLPGMDGIEATRRIRERWPDTRVIILTVDEAGGSVMEAVRAGATAYLSKAASLEDLQRALRTAPDEGIYLSPSVANWFVWSAGDRSTGGRITDREVEVLQLIGEGLTARGIASRLDISERTVDTHVAHLYRRLGVNNRVDVVLEGIRRGLIDPPRRTGRDVMTRR